MKAPRLVASTLPEAAAASPAAAEEEGGRAGRPCAGLEQGSAPRDPGAAECEGDEEECGPRREAPHQREERAFVAVILLRPTGRSQGPSHPGEDVARGGEDEDRGPDLEMEGLEERRRSGGAAEGRDAQGVQGEDEGNAAAAPARRARQGTGQARMAPRHSASTSVPLQSGVIDERPRRAAGVVIRGLLLQPREGKDEPRLHPWGCAAGRTARGSRPARPEGTSSLERGFAGIDE